MRLANAYHNGNSALPEVHCVAKLDVHGVVLRQPAAQELVLRVEARAGQVPLVKRPALWSTYKSLWASP